MNFVSYRQLVSDVRNWSARLPGDLVAVAGVPRSGLVPATLLALHRNIHLVTLDDLSAGRAPWREPLRRNVTPKTEGRVLVLDDSLHAGETMQKLRAQFRNHDRLLFGAVYCDRPMPALVDVSCRRVPAPRCFEWNVFHSALMTLACLDMDGVLCGDWTGIEADEGPGLDDYRRHLETVKPQHVPSYPLHAIVTSRLEKYRPETTAWLRRHGIRFRELVMSPFATAAARRGAGDTARRKADAYARRERALLFVESSDAQAREIARLTGRPVLCGDTMTMHAGTRASVSGSQSSEPSEPVRIPQ
ncbi:MAG: orotate phosphoribosyltransferase [Planctomycetaceae bacterium]